MELLATNMDDHANIGSVLKELSDIKASLAVNTSETSNIKANISEIKVDMKEIKNDFITRRELEGYKQEVTDQLDPLKKSVYGVISITAVAMIGWIVNFIFNR